MIFEYSVANKNQNPM